MTTKLTEIKDNMVAVEQQINELHTKLQFLGNDYQAVKSEEDKVKYAHLLTDGPITQEQIQFLLVKEDRSVRIGDSDYCKYLRTLLERKFKYLKRSIYTGRTQQMIQIRLGRHESTSLCLRELNYFLPYVEHTQSDPRDNIKSGKYFEVYHPSGEYQLVVCPDMSCYVGKYGHGRHFQTLEAAVLYIQDTFG